MDTLGALDIFVLVAERLSFADAGSTGEFWLVWPGERRTSPRLRAFIDFAAENVLAPC